MDVNVKKKIKQYSQLEITIVVFTPFHLVSTFTILDELSKFDVNMEINIIIHKRLKKTLEVFTERIKIFQQIIYFKEPSHVKITRNPYLWFREKQEIKKILNEILSNLREPHVFVCFSDNYIISQGLMSKWKKSYKVLVDEGIAIYSAANEFDKIDKNKAIKILKEILLSFILGFRYRRIGHGSNNLINAIIARYPNLIPKEKLCNKLCYSIDLNKETLEENLHQVSNVLANSFLFISQCLSEDKSTSLEKEIAFYSTLSDILNKKGLNLYIKPHPRDSEKKLNILSKFGFVLWESQFIPVEAISNHELNKFMGIGTFNSSAVLSIKKYKNKILIMGRLLNLDVTTILQLIMNDNSINPNNLINIKNWVELENHT